tara:strand:- start:153 stop:386 length:234 start_codon:yes stop_codon:yes gene_type:complete
MKKLPVNKKMSITEFENLNKEKQKGNSYSTPNGEAKLSKIESLEKKLEWYDYFVDYIYEVDSNKYNQACEFADNKTA